MSTATFNASTLREALGNVAPHMAKGDRLPTLCAVRLECDGNTLTCVATDRYTLATDTVMVLEGYANEAFTTLIDSSDVARILAATKSIPKYMSTYPVEFKVEDGAVTVSVTYSGTSLRCIPVDAEYPKWRGILEGALGACHDDTNATPYAAYNPQLVAKFAKVKSEGRPAGVMRMYFSTASKPAIVEVGVTFRAVLMPCRIAEWAETTAVKAA